MWRHLRYLGGFPVRAKARRQLRQFLHLLHDCRNVQSRTLQQVLDLNRDSAFSRNHDLDKIQTVAEFRRAIPIAGYERALPYIERTMQGEATALLGSANPPLMFALTSGTTASTKYIPITRRFVDDYRRGWQVWGVKNFDDHPPLHLLNIFQATSDHDKFRTPSGLPCGNISGLGQTLQSRAVKLMYTLPDAVTKIGNPEAKYYAALRIGVADKHVGMIMTANPSTFVQIAKLAARCSESLIRDLRNGTLSEEFDIAPELRHRLRRSAHRKNRTRAAELDRLAEKHGHLRPRDFWPHLTVLACWTGGSVAAYLPQLRDWYGPVPIRDHGLSASEGRMTIPLDDETAAGPLDIESHFFEFVPVNEIDSQSPTILLADELEVGQEYFILLTTCSGLYRYDIRDVVLCTGFIGTTPVIEFRHKGAHISSITGEKLTESQVAAALKSASETHRLTLPPVTLCPEWGDPPRYRLLVEQASLREASNFESFVGTLDAELQKLNIEYAEKRGTKRLAPIAIHELADGAWDAFIRERQSRPGGSLEQYKHPVLKPDFDFADRLLVAGTLRVPSAPSESTSESGATR
jgi:hypothetical protein